MFNIAQISKLFPEEISTKTKTRFAGLITTDSINRRVFCRPPKNGGIMLLTSVEYPLLPCDQRAAFLRCYSAPGS